MNGMYPDGNPTVISENFSNKKCFGLINHPVLPAKINNKLKFPGCAKCAAINQKHCDNNDQERALIGTQVSLDVDKAI